MGRLLVDCFRALSLSKGWLLVQGFKGFRVPRFQGFRVSEFQSFKSFKSPEHIC